MYWLFVIYILLLWVRAGKRHVLNTFLHQAVDMRRLTVKLHIHNLLDNHPNHPNSRSHSYLLPLDIPDL